MKKKKIDFNLRKFSELNKKRCESKFHAIDSWSLSDWGCALAGEAGEACNFIKKLRRLEGKFEPLEKSRLKKELGKELADIYTYLDLISTKLGIDLGKEIVDKFNEVSGRCRSKTISYTDVK